MDKLDRVEVLFKIIEGENVEYKSETLETLKTWLSLYGIDSNQEIIDFLEDRNPKYKYELLTTVSIEDLKDYFIPQTKPKQSKKKSSSKKMTPKGKESNENILQISPFVKSFREKQRMKEESITPFHYPDLSDIFDHFDSLKDYFKKMKVYIKDDYLKKILLGIGRDKPIILVGVPSDGKSLTMRIVLDWLTKVYNKDLNPHRNGYGLGWNSLNVNVNTSKKDLFGAIAAESISGGIESFDKRREMLEWGIIYYSILRGEYIYLDEVNRAENELLQRLQGLLAEPYQDKLSEGNILLILKDKFIGLKRSNVVISGSINVGDIGNFPMGKAFKRRAQFVSLDYTTEETVEAVDSVRGITPEQYESIRKELSEINSDIKVLDELIKRIRDFLRMITISIHETTSKWQRDKHVIYRAGIGHIFEVLTSMSLYIYSLFVIDCREKTFSYLDGTEFKDKLRDAVYSALYENMLFQLGDENDLFKMEQLGKLMDKLMVAPILSSIQGIISYILLNTPNSYKISASGYLSLENVDYYKFLIRAIFYWGWD